MDNHFLSRVIFLKVSVVCTLSFYLLLYRFGRSPFPMNLSEFSCPVNSFNIRGWFTMIETGSYELRKGSPPANKTVHVLEKQIQMRISQVP